MEIDVARERGGDGAERLDPADEVRGEDAAVFETEARVPARQLPLQPFVQPGYHLDPHFAIGVGPDLPAGPVGLLELGPEHLGVVDHDAEIVRPTDIRLREPCGALRD